MKKTLIIFALIMASLFAFACGSDRGETQAAETTRFLAENVSQKQNDVKPLITFVELGSVNCIPCRKMQPIMKSIEEKYAGQVKVVFYDVWKADQRKYAEEYGIRLIPTQVFLDKEGKEIMRHVGFFPEVEIDAFMREQGLTPDLEG